jgi:aminoglycoside 3-N-acetyltransferase
MLHADALAAAQLVGVAAAERMNALIDGIRDALGPTGTLVMPTFSYSATKGEVYNPDTTPSDVGMLTDHFRKCAGVMRSRHPIFSVAALGPLAREFSESATDDCFGEGTAFDLLYRYDAWLVAMACPFDRLTFVHFVDQAARVDYRYFKTFPAKIESAGHMEERNVRYFVRDLDRQAEARLDNLRTELASAGLVRNAELGRSRLQCVRAQDFFRTAMALIARQPNALIEEGHESKQHG